MLTPDLTFTDYNAACQQRYACGYVSIGFRKHTNPAYDINFGNYVLNSCGDGWFRKNKDNGISSRHGLCIDKFKLTSKNPTYVGDFRAYKCVIEYTTAEETPDAGFFWLFVHMHYAIEDVVKYIEEHKHQWSP